MRRLLTVALLIWTTAIYGQNSLDTNQSVSADELKTGDTITVTGSDFLLYPVCSVDGFVNGSIALPVKQGGQCVVVSGTGSRNTKRPYNEFLELRTIGDTTVFGFSAFYDIQQFINQKMLVVSNHPADSSIIDRAVLLGGEENALQLVRTQYSSSRPANLNNFLAYHVSFIIETDGTVTNPTTWEEDNVFIDANQKQQIFDAILSMPKWEPARQNGVSILERRHWFLSNR